VAVTWTESADKRGIPHEEVFYAMSHAHKVVREFGQPRIGTAAPTLFIGPSRYGTLEVLATVTPPDGVHVFHVMPLRESTRTAAGYQEGAEP
jgi:hypothetical protein